MKYLIICLMLAFPVFSQSADLSTDWNKECASDIGLTVEEAQKKYGAYGYMTEIDESDSLEVLKIHAELSKKSLENYCIMLSTNYAFHGKGRNDQSIIENFDYITPEFLQMGVDVYKKNYIKALNLIKAKSLGEKEVFHISSLK